MTRELKLYAPTPCIGIGLSKDSLKRALAKEPDAIVVDAGSTDPGPYYLGSGESFTARVLMKSDLEPVLAAVQTHGIPLLISTAGGSGGRPHVQRMYDVIREIAAEQELSFRIATIQTEQPKEQLLGLYAEDRIKPLWPLKGIDAETIERSARVVGLMGAEPYIEALDHHADVILAGRADDASTAACMAIRNDMPPALGWLAGRFLECAAACALPRHGFGFEGLFATIRPDEVLLEPMHPELRCTSRSVVSFLLHERQSPFEAVEPTGTLDLTNLEIDEVDERTVRLRGAQFHENPVGSIRLEGVELAGYRTVTPGWTRDPLLISQIHEFLDRGGKRVVDVMRDQVGFQPEDYTLNFRVVGHNAVMGAREPVTEFVGHELGILIDVVASTQDMARSIAGSTRQMIKNAHFEGKLCDEGCITFPYSPSELDAGAVYRFSIWHAVSPADLLGMFPITYEDVVGEHSSPVVLEVTT